MKKIAVLMSLVLIIGCAGLGKFSEQGAAKAGQWVAMAGNILQTVEILLPILTGLVKVQGFEAKAKPVLDQALAYQGTLKTFIQSHTPDQVISDTEAQQISHVAAGVNEVNAKTQALKQEQVKQLVAENTALQARNDNLIQTLRMIRVK